MGRNFALDDRARDPSSACRPGSAAVSRSRSIASRCCARGVGDWREQTPTSRFVERGDRHRDPEQSPAPAAAKVRQ